MRDKPYEISLTSSSSRVTNDSRKCSKCLPLYVHALALTAYTAAACLDIIHQLVNNIDRHDSDRISDNRYFILARVHYCPSNRKIKVLIVA